jgi:hypothetical protein
MRGTADLQLLETPLPELLFEVTGLAPIGRTDHVLLESVGVRSTQRLALGEVGGGVVAFTWPGELVEQARHLYESKRAPRLLGAGREGGWEVDMRPHLAFRNSHPRQRLYTNPTIDVGKYVTQWAGPDGRRIGAHDPDTIRDGLWPWMLKRGYASSEDEPELDRFLGALGRRPAHLRPGLRMLRRWSADEVGRLRVRGELAGEIRSAVNFLLVAMDDRPLR